MGSGTLVNVLLLGFVLSLCGAAIDADHPIAFLLGIADGRFLHYSLWFALVYCFVCGVTATALAVRWLDLNKE